MKELTMSAVLEHLEDAVLELGLLLFGEEVLEYPYEAFLQRTRQLEALSFAAMDAEEILRAEPDCKKCMRKIASLFAKRCPAQSLPQGGLEAQAAFEPGCLLAAYQELAQGLRQLDALVCGGGRILDADAAFGREKPYASIYARIGEQLRALLLRCKAQPEEFCRQAAAIFSRAEPEFGQFQGAKR